MSVPAGVQRAFRSQVLRELLLEADKQGWEWRVGGKHVVVYPPDRDARPLILSTTAYDGAITMASRAQFRRAGLR